MSNPDLTERVSPRVFRVVALGVPTEREKSQMDFQRYIPHLPAAGEVVLFDRSWYNRAGVERLVGFATEEERGRAERSAGPGQGGVGLGPGALWAARRGTGRWFLTKDHE